MGVKGKGGYIELNLNEFYRTYGGLHGIRLGVNGVYIELK